MVQDASAEQDLILVYMTLINSKLLYYSSFNATMTDIKKFTRFVHSGILWKNGSATSQIP